MQQPSCLRGLSMARDTDLWSLAGSSLSLPSLSLVTCLSLQRPEEAPGQMSRSLAMDLNQHSQMFLMHSSVSFSLTLTVGWAP